MERRAYTHFGSASEPEDDKYDVLVDMLQPAFNDRGRELKREIAETIVPTVNRVKDLYGQIDSKVDENFSKGIITFNNACKELEMLAMRDEDDLKDALAQFKVFSSPERFVARWMTLLVVMIAKKRRVALPTHGSIRNSC